MYAVYQLINSKNPRQSYIGMTGDLKARMARHKSHAKCGDRTHTPLSRAIARDGFKSFYTVLLAEFKTQREARDHERDMIEQREPSLNVNR
jgi:predicted GIY-YIG superfamily endonuclease